MPEINFQPIGKRVTVDRGVTLLDAARDAGIAITSVCGGEGNCGQCRVRIISGELSPHTYDETFELHPEELLAGDRLACCARVQSDITVHLPPTSLLTNTRLQIESNLRSVVVDPLIAAYDIAAPGPTLEDLRSDLARVASQLPATESIHAEPAVICQISPLARELGWQMTVYLRGAELIGIAPQGSAPLGMAVDLGTTKIAAFLIDLRSGAELAAAGVLNPQISYGEDVISRLNYARRNQDGGLVLGRMLQQSLNELLGELVRIAGASRQQVADLCIVGNTAMVHLLLGMPTAQLAAAPYVAASSAPQDVKARELGLQAAPGAYVHIPPCIGGFVGADHVAMVLATDMDRARGISLGLDIGTNTEIAFAKPGTGALTSVSCASGPAFEGAHISDGMRAASGAIEAVRLSRQGVQVKTIEQTPPVGLCGSGIIDAVAELRRAGLINPQGRFQASDTRLREGRSGPELLISPASKSGSGRDVVIGQQDVNEIQLAKGAIRAGLDVLLESTGTRTDEVQEVIIAGAFGSFLNIESALDAGLLPFYPQAVYRQVGNAAAVGAKWALISRAERERALRIAAMTHYLELTTYPRFRRYFALGMAFPADHELRQSKDSSV